MKNLPGLTDIQIRILGAKQTQQDAFCGSQREVVQTAGRALCRVLLGLGELPCWVAFTLYLQRIQGRRILSRGVRWRPLGSYSQNKKSENHKM